MHIINSIPSSFEYLTDYINMWRALMVNGLLHEFSDLTNDETIWNVHCAQEYFIVDLDRGLDDGSHRFTLSSYKDEKSSPRDFSFSR